jgi:hypothetical protein
MNGSSHDYGRNKLNQIEFFFFHTTQTLGTSALTGTWLARACGDRRAAAATA